MSPDVANQLKMVSRPELYPILSLLVYGDSPNPTNVYVESAGFEVVEQGGGQYMVCDGSAAVNFAPIKQYVIGTHAPAPEDVLVNLGRLLHKEKPASMPVLTGSKPGSILFYQPTFAGEANLLLVTPKSVRFSQFASKSLADVDDAYLPMPRCILQIRGKRLNLFALKGDEPVNDSTPLYIPPTLNVSITGSVCLGSMRQPKATDYKTVEDLADACWDMFFLSKGSHEHGAGLQVLTNKQNLTQLYRTFIRDKTQEFPEELLLAVPEKSPYKTVGDLRRELVNLI